MERILRQVTLGARTNAMQAPLGHLEAP